MRNYLNSINNYNEITNDQMEEILEKSINQLEEEYNYRDSNNDTNYSYIGYIETVICQLARHKPELDKYNAIVSEVNEEEEDLYYEVIEDIKFIEDLFYTDFINNLPIKYFDDQVALRTYFNDYLDYLNKDGQISDYTVENIDYTILETDPKNIR